MKSQGGKSQSKKTSRAAAEGDFNLAAVFDLGFFGAVLCSGHYQCGERLENVWRCLDKLAEVIHPNLFTALRDLLAQLTDLWTEISQSRMASIQKGTGFLSRWLRDVREKEDINISTHDVFFGLTLTRSKGSTTRQTRLTRYSKWIKLSQEFRDASWRAIPRSSAYHCWLWCGRVLGEWISEHMLMGEASPFFGSLAEPFQQRVLELPLEFRARTSWLTRFAKYKIREDTAIELSKLIRNRVEPFGENGEHHDYQLQLAILYYRIIEEILNFEGKYTLPTQEVSGSGGRVWMPVKEAIKFAWENFQVDLNYNEITRRSTGQDPRFLSRQSKSHSQRREVELGSFVLYLQSEKGKLDRKNTPTTSGENDDDDALEDDELRDEDMRAGLEWRLPTPYTDEMQHPPMCPWAKRCSRTQCKPQRAASDLGLLPGRCSLPCSFQPNSPIAWGTIDVIANAHRNGRTIMSEKKAQKPDGATKGPVTSSTEGMKSGGQDPKMFAHIVPKDEHEAKVLASEGYTLCPGDEHGKNCRRIPCDPSLASMLLRDLCRAGITQPKIEFDMRRLTVEDLREIDQDLLFGVHSKVAIHRIMVLQARYGPFQKYCDTGIDLK